MAYNRFHKPIERYVPIPFQELMTVGRELNRQRELAEGELNANIRQFGKFISPSRVDMENYNKESIGKLAPFLEQAQANPEVMKDAAWRASLQTQLNNIDYAKLGMLEQSANNLREGLKMRAQMEAEGLYNPNWDRSDIPNYDTLGSKEVFSDITPVKYMTANDLSNKYFDNLKAGDLGPVWRDGVKYRAIGNSAEDLEKIYDTYENDLINSPQGREYMRQFISDNGGDINAARSAFRSMIIASQMDRTLRPSLEVDQGWLAKEKLNAARAAAVPQPQPEIVSPTRKQQIGNNIVEKVITQMSKLPSDVQDEYMLYSSTAEMYAEKYNKAMEAYNKSGKDEDLIYANQLKSRAMQTANQANSVYFNNIMRDAFKTTANFDLNNDPTKNEKYNREGYIAGAKAAVRSISGTTALHNISDGGDPLLTKAGGIPEEYTTKDGRKENVYSFNNSAGFLLPETILQFGTNTKPIKTTREAGVLRDNSFPLREAIETGSIRNVLFKPNAQDNILQIDNRKMINGKILISKKELEDNIENNWFFDPSGFFPTSLIYGPIAGRQSPSDAIKEQYNAKEVVYGDNNIWYEMDASYVIPDDDNDEYWYDVNQLRENSPSSGGIGGASQAEKQKQATLQTLMLQ